MYSGERRDRIKDILYVRKNVSVSEFADALNVSSETIRRDLVVLEKEGFLTKTYGGATLSKTYSKTFSPASNSEILSKEMHLIAKSASKLIKHNDTIFLDHSTTARYLCDELNAKNLTVITNSLNIVNILAGKEDISLILCGGNYNPKRNAFFGNNAIDCIENLHIDTCFISPTSLNLKNGIYARNEEEKNIRLAAIDNSDNTVVLVDHTKFTRYGKVSLLKDYEKIDLIITDCNLDAEWKKLLGDKIIKA